ncbi:MAG: hypothetical protein MHPSP_001726, partial [Paramarteilia canceri]
ETAIQDDQRLSTDDILNFNETINSESNSDFDMRIEDLLSDNSNYSSSHEIWENCENQNRNLEDEIFEMSLI